MMLQTRSLHHRKVETKTKKQQQKQVTANESRKKTLSCKLVGFIYKGRPF